MDSTASRDEPPDPAEPRIEYEDDRLRIVATTEPPGLRLAGEIDLSNRDGLQRALARFAGCRHDVHLDVADLAFIDVAGAALLADAARGLAAGSRLILHSPGYSVRRLFGTLRLDEIEQLVVDPEEPT